MDEPELSLKTYVFTYFGMLGLLLLNILLAYINMGRVNMFIGLTIAAGQAFLVAFILMKGLYEKVLVRLMMAGAMLWFMIMMTLTLTDYITRNWVPIPGK
jgi:cytochrome c oxidase subunit 4